MRKKGQLDERQKQTRYENYEKIRNILRLERCRKIDIHKKTRISRRIIDKHLKRAGSNVVKDDNGYFFWKSTYDKLVPWLKRIEKEENETFLDRNCITSIGNVQGTLHKSLTGIWDRLCFEKNLRQRHRRELETYREEFLNAKTKAEQIRVDAKIRENVGWTVGEYFEKLLKKAEKEKDLRKKLTLYGLRDPAKTEHTVRRKLLRLDKSLLST